MRRILWFLAGLLLGVFSAGGVAGDVADRRPASVETHLESVQARLDALEQLLADVPPRLSEVRVGLERIASFVDPVDIATRPGDGHLYVATRPGMIYAIPSAVRGPAGDPYVVLDISANVDTKGAKTGAGGEAGLLGITFSPDGSRLYTVYTVPPEDGGDGLEWVLAEFAVGDRAALRSSRRVLVTFPKARAHHNGGGIRFGPDGYLYVSIGDGWPFSDVLETGQDRSDLLGSILRIDPSSPRGRRPYSIPADNPFARGDGAPEVWVYGARNPWRFSFDRVNGDLWIADVGEHAQEEINVLHAARGGGRGANLGWRVFEGTDRIDEETDTPLDYVPPVYTYSREGGCAVIGGFRYRGHSIPALWGAYVFADLCKGQLHALALDDGRADARPLDVEITNPTSFGEDDSGELYVLSLKGGIYRIVAAR